MNIERTREIWRSASCMEGYFRALIAEYPKAVEQGRLEKWAAAAHSYIDLMAIPPAEPIDAAIASKGDSK